MSRYLTKPLEGKLRVSRAPEHRGGGGSSPVLLMLVLIAILVVGAAVAYLLLGQNSPGQAQEPSNPTQPAQSTVAAGSPNVGNAPPVATQPPQPTALPAATTAPNEAMAQTGCEAEPPRADFGEVVAEGFVDLRLMNADVLSWYSLQLDTGTRTTTFFFALFDAAGCTLSRTALITDYTPTEVIDNAEVTVYYPNALERSVTFDRAAGTLISRQFYNANAHEPGMFSSQTRISLSQQNLVLTDTDGTIRADMSIDLTGLSTQENIAIRQENPPVVENSLNELQLIVDQIESRRPKSQ